MTRKKQRICKARVYHIDDHGIVVNIKEGPQEFNRQCGVALDWKHRWCALRTGKRWNLVSLYCRSIRTDRPKEGQLILVDMNSSRWVTTDEVFDRRRSQYRNKKASTNGKSRRSHGSRAFAA